MQAFRPALNAALVLRRDELAKHVGKDAAVSECDELFGRVDARRRLELDRGAAIRYGADADAAAWPQALSDAGQLEALASGEAERRRRDAGDKLERKNAHVHEVAAMNALEALGDDRFHAEQKRSLRR